MQRFQDKIAKIYFNYFMLASYLMDMIVHRHRSKAKARKVREPYQMTCFSLVQLLRDCEKIRAKS